MSIGWSKEYRWWGGVLSACLLLALPAWGTRLIGDDELDEEFRFASGLIEFGLPDYAQIVAQRVLDQHPETKDRVDMIRAEAFIAARKFDEAKALLATMPDEGSKAQAVKLALADGYYRAGNVDACSEIYEAFFAQYASGPPTDTDVRRFYRGAAYKFGQMLVKQERVGEAANVYQHLLKVIEAREMRRQVLLEQAELLVRSARGLEGKDRRHKLEQADANCAEILWGGMDLWFGRALSVLAQITDLRGDREEATRILALNQVVLKKLDDLLEESGIPLSESPFAGARMLMGDFAREVGEGLLGAPEVREAVALDYLEKALAAYRTKWALITRTYRHDQALVKRSHDESILRGKRAQRQKPFDDMAREAAALRDALAGAAPNTWHATVSSRASKLTGSIAQLVKAVADHPRDLGVTVRPEMAFGDRFKGYTLRDQGLLHLADAEQRKGAAVNAYQGALGHYYNVFAGYPGSTWSEDASRYIESLKGLLGDLTGQEVSIKTRGSGEAKLARVLLHEGHRLFDREQYGPMIESYTKGLAGDPEGSDSLMALNNMLLAYIALGDTLRVRMVTDYLGERFRDRAEAPAILLRAAKQHLDRKEEALATDAYEGFLRHFPDHTSAPMILFMLGERRWEREERLKARPYYERLITTYGQSSYALEALNRIGWSYYLAQEYDPAIKTFNKLVSQAPHGKLRAQGKLCIADAFRQKGAHAAAVKQYVELTKWMTDKKLVYTRSNSLPAEIREIREQAAFFRGFCLTQLQDPAEKVPAYRAAAAKIYRDFVDRFPNSALASSALSSLGAVHIMLEDSDRAADVYEELSRRYPDSEVGQSARYAMLRSLLDVDQVIRASEVLREMIASSGEYPAMQFLQAGDLMLKHEQPEEAILAYKQARSRMQQGDADKDVAQMDQRALFGMGKAYHAAGKAEDSVRMINTLIDTHPTTGFFYDARFLLADIHRDQGQPAEAIVVLKDIFKRASDPAVINRATIALAHLQIAENRPKDALASTQRIVLLADPSDPVVRPFFEEALYLGVKLQGEGERWPDVLADSARYEETFPNGRWLSDVRRWRTRARTRSVEDM